jgi:hypothetical protein
MNTHKKISDKYCPRFGQTAVEMGFISDDQLKKALCRQIDDELSGKEHRLLGSILFDNDLMSSEQIEVVLNTMLKAMRAEENM